MFWIVLSSHLQLPVNRAIPHFENLVLIFSMLPLNYFLYLQIILFLFITPGTPRIVIVSYAMNYGVKNCIWTALGDIFANIAQATLVIFVLGSFFSKNPSFLNILKWAGIIYLIYLAYDLYKTRPKNPTSKNIVKKRKNYLNIIPDRNTYKPNAIIYFYCYYLQNYHSVQNFLYFLSLPDFEAEN